jgi:hypothetical protein
MASGNWTHLFIDGRRVSFDRRDNSVTWFPDDGFRLSASHRIGYAEGKGTSWVATSPTGKTHHAAGRKAAAVWLIEQSTDDIAAKERDRATERRRQEAAREEAMAVINRIWPDHRPPGPLMGDDDAPIYFIFEPTEMRDLLEVTLALGRETATSA